MPMYEYECLSCGKRTERLQRFDDPPLATCPSCGGEVKKLISAPAVQFKGSGWYVTDYAKGSSAGGRSESSGSKDGKESKESGGSKESSGSKESGGSKESASSSESKSSAPSSGGGSGGE
jgi:putative FmdB family regulatory protein